MHTSLAARCRRARPAEGGFLSPCGGGLRRGVAPNFENLAPFPPNERSARPPPCPAPTRGAGTLAAIERRTAAKRCVHPVELGWGRWREAPDGVWTGAPTSHRSCNRRVEGHSISSCPPRCVLASSNRFADEIALRLPERGANPLDHQGQSADNQIVRKSQHAKSRATKPCVSLGVSDLRVDATRACGRRLRR